MSSANRLHLPTKHAKPGCARFLLLFLGFLTDSPVLLCSLSYIMKHIHWDRVVVLQMTIISETYQSYFLLALKPLCALCNTI